jgi:MHS family proline/betaine transporter-like MFS transporter
LEVLEKVMKKAKIILASVLGNALEFYDFTLYGIFTLSIAHTYFPSQDETTSILQSLMAFAAGFVMRPFGAAVFGYVGDRFGRKRALTLSILLMGIPTFLIGILPSYETIGVWAPFVIVLCRLLQGLCTGGEYNGAAIFALEHVGKNYPGFTGGLITGSAGLGALMAMGMGIFILMPGMPSWAWRIPFIMGSFASIFGWYFRRNMDESPDFMKLQKSQKISSSPLKEAVLNHKFATFMTMIFGAFDGVLSYLLFVFLDVYLSFYLGVNSIASREITFIGILVFTIGSPLMGYFLDRWEGRKFLITSSLLILGFIVPVFWMIQTNSFILWLIATILLGIMAASIAGAQHAFVQKLFPIQDRYSGISFSFSVGMSLGGATPFLLTYLLKTTGHLMAPAYYVMGWSLICFGALYKLRSKVGNRA